jgi:uncharacterized protein YxjI
LIAFEAGSCFLIVHGHGRCWAAVAGLLIELNISRWNFKFLSGETELGIVTKKWAGFGKELFTSADNYIISINGAPNPTINLLLLASGLAIDTVLKEKQ